MENIQKSKIAQNVLTYTPGVNFLPNKNSSLELKILNFYGKSVLLEGNQGGDSTANNAHTTVPCYQIEVTK